MLRLPLLCLAGLAVSLPACGSSKSGFETDPGSSSGNTSSSGGFIEAKPDGGLVSPDGCSEAAKLVYVVSQQNDLYSFKPDKLTFTKIGTLDCPAAFSASPNSMAVDRSGTAWVNYNDGTLFKVSTADASCQATNFQPNQSGFGRFGMAFASNSAGSSDETLFVSGIAGVNAGLGLAKIDVGTLKLTTLGDFSGSLEGKAAELTGTGEGKLYGFFTTTPATLAQIDKAAAATSGAKTLSGVSTGLAWAFSFWGGDFWFYTSSGTAPSTVTRLKASSDNSISVVMQNVGGFSIVGAGVSTCAPTTPVN
jgi:hypothetical protein